MSSEPNGKRKSVFLTLVEDGGELTPSEISERVGETRQTVKYHLDELVDRGLVVRDDGHYRCQPVFTDDDIEKAFADVMADLVTDVNERILVDHDVPAEERTAIVFNCIRMFVAIELLEPVEEE